MAFECIVSIGLIGFFILIAGATALFYKALGYFAGDDEEVPSNCMRRWQFARSERRAWLREHAYVQDPFNYPDYQRAWRNELDAESAANKCTRKREWKSWNEYIAEERAHEAKRK